MTAEEKHAKRVAAANAAFRKLPKAKQRVVVAKDVIASLNARRIRPVDGIHLDVPDLYGASVDNPGGSFQELLPKLPACEGCAKGAIFVCTVARRNEVTNAQASNMIRRDWDGDRLSQWIGGVFSPRQLAMIEASFEGQVFDQGYKNLTVPRAKGRSYRQRMITIMKNIIRNKGTFKPTPDGR